MTKKNWIHLETASGKTMLDIGSIIAMTKTYDTFGKEQWDLHMTSGTIFSINHAEYEILMERMKEEAKPKYPGYSGNFPPSHSYGLSRWDGEARWSEEVIRLQSIADDLYTYIVSDADISLKIIEEQMDWREEE